MTVLALILAIVRMGLSVISIQATVLMAVMMGIPLKTSGEVPGLGQDAKLVGYEQTSILVCG